MSFTFLITLWYFYFSSIYWIFLLFLNLWYFLFYYFSFYFFFIIYCIYFICFSPLTYINYYLISFWKHVSILFYNQFYFIFQLLLLSVRIIFQILGICTMVPAVYTVNLRICNGGRLGIKDYVHWFNSFQAYCFQSNCQATVLFYNDNIFNTMLTLMSWQCRKVLI